MKHRPSLQTALVAANMGPISTVAGAAAGPFTVHFWVTHVLLRAGA